MLIACYLVDFLLVFSGISRFGIISPKVDRM